MFPEKFNNKTNGITQRRFLMHGNPLLADWVTKHIGDGWITELMQLARLSSVCIGRKSPEGVHGDQAQEQSAPGRVYQGA